MPDGSLDGGRLGRLRGETPLGETVWTFGSVLFAEGDRWLSAAVGNLKALSDPRGAQIKLPRGKGRLSHRVREIINNPRLINVVLLGQV